MQQLFFFRQNRIGEFLPADQLRELQNRRLQELIAHAVMHVPFHRQRFQAAGIRPEDIRTSDDLPHLPLMRKQHLQETPQEELRADSIPLHTCKWIATSGSTGRPLQLVYRSQDLTRHSLNWLRPMRAQGIGLRRRRFEITGAHNIAHRKSWYQHLGILRRRSISIFESPEQWLDGIVRYRPHYLWSYGGALKILGQYLREVKIVPPPLQAVFGVSDTVDAACRLLIEEAWNLPVIDIYGATEGGCIAWECPVCRGYHINSDSVIVEILAEKRSVPRGTPGHIAITDLYSFAMPLIRYQLDDIGTFSEDIPRCGRSLPLLKRIEGRGDAFIRLPSGRRLAPLFLDNILKHFLEVKEWRAVQESDGSIMIAVIMTPGCGRNILALLNGRIRQTLPEPLTVTVRQVETIPALSSGKRCAVISKIDDE